MPKAGRGESSACVRAVAVNQARPAGRRPQLADGRHAVQVQVDRYATAYGRPPATCILHQHASTHPSQL